MGAFAAPQLPARQRPPSAGNQTQRQPHAPKEHVLAGKEDGGAGGPLPPGGVIHLTALLGPNLAQPLEPLWTGAQAQKARPLEGIGLGDAEGDDGEEAGEEEVKDEAGDAVRIAYCVVRIAYCVVRGAYCVLREGGEGDKEGGCDGADFAGGGQTGRQARQGKADPTPRLGGANREIGGQDGEKAGHTIHGKEMGLLDLKGGQCAQRRRQQSHGFPVQAPPDQVDEQERAQVGQPRKGPPHQFAARAGEGARRADGKVARRRGGKEQSGHGHARPGGRWATGAVEPLGGYARQKERQCAVAVATVAIVTHVERRAVGVKVKRPVFRCVDGPQRALHMRFVGMDPQSLVPVQVGKAQNRRHQEDEGEGKTDCVVRGAYCVVRGA